MKKLFYAVILMSLTACFEQDSGTSTSSNSTTGSNGGGDISNTSGTNGNTTGNTTTGTNGNNGGYPYHDFNLLLSGGKSWVPGTYTDNLAQETQITVQEARLLFASDTKLRVRFKVNSQPRPTSGDKYCWDRATGQSPLPRYDKLRFEVSLRDIKCDVPNPNNTNLCNSGFYLDPVRYNRTIVGPVNAEGYSEILNLGPERNYSVYGTTVEVHNVQSDSACQFSGSSQDCPAHATVQSGSCWHMTMEVVTDYTNDF